MLIQHLFYCKHGFLVSFPVVVKYLGKSNIAEKGFIWLKVLDQAHRTSHSREENEFQLSLDYEAVPHLRKQQKLVVFNIL